MKLLKETSNLSTDNITILKNIIDEVRDDINKGNWISVYDAIDKLDLDNNKVKYNLFNIINDTLIKLDIDPIKVNSSYIDNLNVDDVLQVDFDDNSVFLEHEDADGQFTTYGYNKNRLKSLLKLKNIDLDNDIDIWFKFASIHIRNLSIVSSDGTKVDLNRSDEDLDGLNEERVFYDLLNTPADIRVELTKSGKLISSDSNNIHNFIYDIANSDPDARSLYCWIKDFTLHLGSGVEKTLSLYSDWYWFGSDGAWIADDICKLCEPYIIDYFKSLLGIK